MYLSRISATAWCLSASPQGLCLSLAAGNLPRSGASWRRTKTQNSRNNIWGNMCLTSHSNSYLEIIYEEPKWRLQPVAKVLETLYRILAWTACPWSCACDVPLPLMEEQLWMGGRREVSIISHRPVTSSDLKQKRSFFRGSVSTFLQLVVATSVKFQAFKLRGRCKEMYCCDGYTFCRSPPPPFSYVDVDVCA